MDTTASGLLVAATSRGYDFTDDTGKRIQGTKHRVYLVPSFDRDPQEVTIKDPVILETLQSVGLGGQVSLACTAFARGRGRLELVADSIISAVAAKDAAKRPAPAAS